MPTVKSPNSETQVDTIGKEVDKFSITVKEPSRKMAHHNAVISLEIPNKLFLLWKSLRDLQQKLGKQQSSLIHLVNQSIKGKLASVKEVTSVDERIRKLFSTFHSNYTKMQSGAKRSKTMSETTRLLVFEHEAKSHDETAAKAKDDLKFHGNHRYS